MGVNTDWKLRLRYGRLQTPYTHFTLIADGALTRPNEKLDGKPGKAFLGAKIWAKDGDQAFDIFRDVADRAGFEIRDKIDLWTTEPKHPPGDIPSVHDPKLTPYRED
jgi:hypothetical protein